MFMRRMNWYTCFNEAAAYHCGKHTTTTEPLVKRMCFNEAAAYHCGKPADRVLQGLPAGVASMRPQHITAENANVGAQDAPALTLQ